MRNFPWGATTGHNRKEGRVRLELDEKACRSELSGQPTRLSESLVRLKEAVLAGLAKDSNETSG